MRSWNLTTTITDSFSSIKSIRIGPLKFTEADCAHHDHDCHFPVASSNIYGLLFTKFHAQNSHFHRKHGFHDRISYAMQRIYLAMKNHWQRQPQVLVSRSTSWFRRVDCVQVRTWWFNNGSKNWSFPVIIDVRIHAAMMLRSSSLWRTSAFREGWWSCWWLRAASVRLHSQKAKSCGTKACSDWRRADVEGYHAD